MERSTSGSSDSTDSLSGLRPLFPSNYELVSFLGRGGFGEVLKCIKEDTKEIAAVKIPHQGCNCNNELTLMNYFKRKNLDQCNIIRFIDSFMLTDNRTALAFEMLDVTLRDFIIYQRDFTPLDLHDVRSVIQQMATALNALKTIEVIHSDIKCDNIMLVDRGAQPLRVKLIDFGLAFPACRAKQGKRHQASHYRAPEIILGLPFTEAIDMWSLGVVMAFIALGDALFPGNSEYDVMRCIVDLLGVPPDHLLSVGWYSDLYFKRLPNRWRLKTPWEYWRNFTPAGDYRAYHFHKLDDVETLPLQNLNMVEADEKKEFIDLLKAMFQLDISDRITPSQVLNHPFITRGTLHHSFINETLDSRHTNEPGTINKAEQDSPAPNFPPGVRLPQTAGGLSWDEESEGQYDTCLSGSSGFHGSTSATSAPRVLRIFVKPAPPDRRTRLQDSDIPLDKQPVSEDSQVKDPSKVKMPPPSRPVPEDSDTTSDTEPEEKTTEKKKKKKKNCFRRLFCWMRRTFYSCISVDDDEG